jgi:hypothetical protein
VGRGYDDDTYYPGEIAEVLVYERALSELERQTVEQYLTNKYFMPAGSQAPNQALSPPLPEDVLTSGNVSDEYGGWKAVDRNESTAWIGDRDSLSWWIALRYGSATRVSDVITIPDEHSLSPSTYLGSMDAENWMDLSRELLVAPVDLIYLMLLFDDDGSGRIPSVREIRVE